VNSQERVQKYFQAIRLGLLAAAGEAVTGHPGLTGGHRENVCRNYLSKVLPKRYDIGKGMVYGLGHRSREADIVIWDSLNFPHLDTSDHTFFFAESARAILEVKSQWSADNFDDIRQKARAARDIIAMHSPNLVDELEMIRMDVAALKLGREHDGIVSVKPHIATGAIVLQGGQQFGPADLTDELIDRADDEWPDLLVLLEAGQFVLKRYGYDNQGYPRAQIEFYDLGEDCLLAFTSALLTLLSDRVVHYEAPLYFEMYADEVASQRPYSVHPFKLYRPPAHQRPLWRNA